MKYLKLYDNDEAHVLDLLGGRLRVRGWQWAAPRTALQQRMTNLPFGTQAQSQGYTPVVETIPLVVTGCADEMRDALAMLEVLLEEAAAHHDDPLVEQPVWLECRSEGELARRTLVTGGTWAITSRIDSWHLLDGKQLNLILTLSRYPFWENVISSSDDTNGLSAVGGMWLWNDTAGRVPARISEARFVADCTGFYAAVDNTITTIWAGWRPEYKGLTMFNPIWECESTATGGGMSTFDDGGETVNLVDGTFHNSVSAHTVFADATLKDRLHIRVQDVIFANPAAPHDPTEGARHFAGRYLVLCRTWVDSGQATLQMRCGYVASQTTVAFDPVVVDNTAPHYKELGTVQIPPPGLWPEVATPVVTDYDAQCSQFTIWLYSQSNDSGAIDANTLDCDCLVLIPADYFLRLEDAKADCGVKGTYYTVASTLHNDRVIGTVEEISGLGEPEVEGSALPSPGQWYLPTGDSMLVVAAEADQGQDVDDLLTLYITWRPRWLSYRE